MGFSFGDEPEFVGTDDAAGDEENEAWGLELELREEPTDYHPGHTGYHYGVLPVLIKERRRAS